MLHIRNKLPILMLGLMLGLLFYFGLFFVVNLIPSRVAVFSDDSILQFYKIAEHRQFESKFVASGNNLNRIDVLFKNPNLESRDELSISVYDDKKLVYQQMFSGFNFGDTSRARLDFDKIADSQGRSYRVELALTKMIDGKLEFGTKSGNLDIVTYYKTGGNLVEAKNKTMELIMNPVLYIWIIPFIFCLW